MDAVDLFKSFSEPIRLRIMHLLSNTHPELCVCDLVTVLGCPQGTISRHLMHLRMVGMVEDRREGVWVYYRLATPTSKAHEAMLKCLKSCFCDDELLSQDLQKFHKLKQDNSLACCVPQNPQGRPLSPAPETRKKVKS